MFRHDRSVNSSTRHLDFRAVLKKNTQYRNKSNRPGQLVQGKGVEKNIQQRVFASGHPPNY